MLYWKNYNYYKSEHKTIMIVCGHYEWSTFSLSAYDFSIVFLELIIV